ncbi:uncharacterized protein LOC134800665 [Cydia splendana]|uniref:uncharacterized protein LOC134800665 n=1 Tax=Cydia splendana TaxID=1100963 RepID=UPI00300C418C
MYNSFSLLINVLFNLQLVLGGSGSCGICSACVGRLRDASDFKLQVQRSQAELQALLVKAESAAKVELADDGADDDSVFDVLYEEPVLVDQSEVGEEKTKELMAESAAKSEQADDGADDDSVFDVLYVDPLVKSETDDVMSDGGSSAAVCSDGSAARAREQLAMACSVVLERLRDDATVHSRDKPFYCENCGEHFRSKTILRKHTRVDRTKTICLCFL